MNKETMPAGIGEKTMTTLLLRPAMKKLLLSLLMLMSVASGAMAQANFPNRTIRILVPYTAGSGSDTSARFFGERLAAALGSAVVVENKPGASGVVAVMATKAAPADGHTILLVGTSQLAVNPFTIKDLPYDPNKDLRALAGLTRGMNALIVSSNSRFKTLAELLAAAKGKAPLTIGTYSAGYQLAMEWLASLAGVKFTNVPYKGAAPIFTDIIGGQLDFSIVDLGGVASLVKSGKVRLLAVSGEKRHPDFPDAPTIRESGFPEYVNYSCTSLYLRADTPDDVTARLSDALQKALASPEAREFVKENGGELMPHNPSAMERYQRDEYERFKRIATLAGIKPQ